MNLTKIKADINEALDRNWSSTGEWQPSKTREYQLKSSRVIFMPEINRAFYDGVVGYAEAVIMNGEIKQVLTDQEGTHG